MSIKTINTQIKTMLDGLITTAGLKRAYEYPDNLLEGYPAAVLIYKGCNAEFLDSKRNKRTYLFTIKLLQETAKVGVSEAARILHELTDEVFEAFDEDIDLSGKALLVRPVSSGPLETEDIQEGIVYKTEIDIEAILTTNRN